MNTPVPMTDSSEAILARFVQELEEAADPEAVVRGYQAAYPLQAAEFPATAAMMRKVERSRPGGGEDLPPYLGGFRLVRRIAQGGMGEVFEALEERLERRVAIKIIHRQRLSPVHRCRFLREQRVLAQLHQTHIVPIFAAGEVGTFQYFAMPYIEGAALHHALEVVRQQRTPWPSGKPLDLSTLAEMHRASTGQAGPATAPQAGAETVPVKVDPRPVRRALSRAYFRSVAAVMADVAEGLQHAHEAGIIHRDVKPSNIMIERDEKCWIIDFGLAGYRHQAGADGQSPGPVDLAAGFMPVSGVLGTPQYMAPEQWTDGQQVDARADVWGLGATLYELLTLQPAFKGSSDAEVRTKVLSTHPQPPRRQVRGLPADLEAICLKALQKKPEQRYQSAHAFAEDLKRWLRDEPAGPSRMRRLRQAAWWVRQNMGLAASLMAIVLTVVGLLAAWGAVEKATANAAQVRADAEEARADAAAGALLLQQAQQIRQGDRKMGWSNQALDLVVEAAPLRIADARRNQAAAALAGLDARVVKHLRHGASAFVWDRDGKRLLMGAAEDGTASLWESERDEEIRFVYGGRGPVAFRTDATAVQLVAHPKDRWLVGLWDVAKGRQIRAFQVPPGGKAEPPTALSPVLLALTDDGSFLAAATIGADDKGHGAAWESGSGKLLVKAEGKMTALALSPDGAFLAAGDEEGRVRLWSLSEGKELEPVRFGRAAIHCLAFGRNPHRLEASRDDAQNPPWLLASGEAGGMVTVWDLRARQVKSRCLGSHWAVFTLAFSPDGMTLASAGRSGRLWDVATGELLLILDAGDFATGLAFSPDGRRLAVSSHYFGDTGFGGVVIHELDLGRGMQTLRGLVGPISHVRFSPDGRWVAALAHNWQVAIWDLRQNRLLHVLDVPQGLFADNADLCFSSDGAQFAFVTGKQARMWEVVSGHELGSWDLPPGLTDQLAFRSQDELVLFRTETADGKPPYSETSWRLHPRVCRLRHLTRRNQIKLLAEIKDFNRHVFAAVISPQGSYLVAEGLGDADGMTHTVRIYEGTTGKEVGTLPLNRTTPYGWLLLDGTGTILAYQPASSDQTTLVEVPSGKVRGVLPRGLARLGPEANYWVVGQRAHETPGLTLVQGQEGKRLLTVGIDSEIHPGPFNSAGTLWAWGNADGSVTVCDIPAVQRRLAAIGLGW